MSSTETLMSFFDSIEAAPPDPILGLTVAFKEDTRAEKVNLGVGAYKTDELTPLVLGAVRKAEQKIVGQDLNKEYLGIDGNPDYTSATQELVFADSLPAERVFAAQTPGGTGALRVAGEFLAQHVTKTIYVSDPTWANHTPVFHAAGLEVNSFPYYNAENKSLRFDEMCAAIEKIPAGSAILLHAACHNPTGVDPSEDQWRQLSDLIIKQGVLPLLDFAYQGFGRGVEEDAFAVRHFAAAGHSMLVCSSFSKNLGLYGERVGAFFVVAGDAESAARSGSQVKRIIRSNYSNPPVHGSRIAAMVLTDSDLRREWEEELSQMRGRINGVRRQLADALAAGGDFSFMAKQYGMFSFSGLTKDQVARLRKEYAIYMPGSGRINVAGLSPKNLDYVAQAILSVL